MQTLIGDPDRPQFGRPLMIGSELHTHQVHEQTRIRQRRLFENAERPMRDNLWWLS
jgi:hypothetical protein